jgi:hypothetical protein
LQPSTRHEFRDPLNIGCGQIDSGWHACALFQGEEEEYQALVPLHGGRFEPERVLAFIGDMMRRNRLRYPRTRLWANMQWSLSDAPGCEQLTPVPCW